MRKRVIVLLLISFSYLNFISALSVTPSVSNILCGTYSITYTFDCTFTGTVLFTSAPPSSVSYSIIPGTLQNVVNGQITFDAIVAVSNAPGSFSVNFVVISSNMGCTMGPSGGQLSANTSVGFNCVTPPNDLCSGALPLSIATNSCTVSAFSTTNTMFSGINPSCSFSGWVDLWYSFTATNDTVSLLMNNAPGFLGVATLYDGTSGCSNLTTVTPCTNLFSLPTTLEFTGLVVNNIYYLQLFHNPAGNGTDQEICLHSTTPQPTAPPCPSMVTLNGSESGTVDTESMDWIKSDQILLPSSVIDYDATDSIVLLPNFEVQLGSIFHAFIDGCGGAMIKEEKETVIEK